MKQEAGVREAETDVEGWGRFPSRCRFAAVLQSFSWSEDSAVAQPRALRNHGTRMARSSQRALLCECVDAYEN